MLGREAVRTDLKPYPFTDDCAHFLNRAPGAYFFLGQGGPMVHQSVYDYNDALLPIAASIFLEIVERRLGA